MSGETDPSPQKAAKRRTPNWPHAPSHRLSESGTFLVTAGTYLKKPFFDSDERLRGLHGGLLKYAKQYGWKLEAWAVFPNHYHFIGHSPQIGSGSLRNFLADFHQHAASWVNALDNLKSRKVWHNFWETKLTHEKSFGARLNYVHHNAVKHGVVNVASRYPWCSASWFERIATSAQIKTIYGFKTDKLKIPDDF